MKKIITGLLFTLLFVNNSYARFQTLQEADIKYDFYNRDLVIHKDGTHESIVEYQITLLREQARGFAAKFPIMYNSDSTSVDIIEAKSTLKGKEYPVESSMIEDKEVQNNEQGFDDTKQISISFPKPEVGATIYLKYKMHTKKVPLKNKFFSGYYFGTDGYWEKSNVTINSAIALQMQINDPYKKLSVKKEAIKNKPNYFYKAQITLEKPVIIRTINEARSSVLNNKHLTYISVVSTDSWQELGEALSVDYKKVLDQKMPQLFLDIVEAASKEKNTIDQINKVTTMLNEKIEYFGSWRTIEGKFIPQDLEAVVTKQSGDCKDFATITTKILNALGHKANVSLVFRGSSYQPEPDILPTLKAFNHAMVRVVDDSGKVYWIDPTNYLSMADGLFKDIAGKYSLVLDAEKSKYEQIPSILENHAKTLITNTIARDKIATSRIELIGEQATVLTSADLYLSKQSVEDFVFNNFATNNINTKDRVNSAIPVLMSRVVKPITISLTFKDPNLFSKTNLGLAYALKTSNLTFVNSIIDVDKQEDVQDLYLGYPRTIQRKTIIKDIKVQNIKNLNFKLNNPFVSLSRQAHIEDNDTIIVEQAIIHKSRIENDKFQSEDFNKLQNAVLDNLIDYSVILPD